MVLSFGIFKNIGLDPVLHKYSTIEPILKLLSVPIKSEFLINLLGKESIKVMGKSSEALEITSLVSGEPMDAIIAPSTPIDRK